jgi:drug/metabolite transporter (DMT)-like permease
MLIVLGAATLHATWNAMIKAGTDKLLDTVLITSSAGIIAAIFLPWLPLPAPASWPYLGASVAIHIGYFCCIALAYRVGDLSYVYPIMRGTAPLLTVVVAQFTVDEPLSVGSILGIGCLSLGIFTLTGDAFRTSTLQLAPTLFALANAVVIVSYTLVDGVGVRLSGHPASYVQWLFFLNAFPLLGFVLLTRARALRKRVTEAWAVGLVGGLCTMASYGLALWAMTRAPIALVAALRETSVIVATIIGAYYLHERFGIQRYVAVGLVTGGVIAMKVW